MKFNYPNYGDILYGVETFRFRFQGSETAEITLLTMLDENQFTYDIQITDERVPSDFRKISSVDISQLSESLSINMKGIFNDKQEALQNAVEVISAIMSKHDLIKANSILDTLKDS